MNSPTELPADAVQLFEPDPNAVYTIEAVEHMAQMPRRLIAIYCKHGLLSPVVDPACGGFYFNDEAIRILRRIDYLRSICGINLVGIKMILHLLKDVEDLRAEASFLGR